MELLELFLVLPLRPLPSVAMATDLTYIRSRGIARSPSVSGWSQEGFLRPLGSDGCETPRSSGFGSSPVFQTGFAGGLGRNRGRGLLFGGCRRTMGPLPT